MRNAPSKESGALFAPLRHTPLIVSILLLFTLGSPAFAQFSTPTTSLVFPNSLNPSNPNQAFLFLSSNPPGLAFQMSILTSSGGNWLSATAAVANVTPNQLTVTVNPAGLAPGGYTGTILITAANGSVAPISIQIALAVPSSPATSFTISPSSLTFSAPSNSVPQSVTLVANAATSYVATTNQPWLSVTPSSGSGAPNFTFLVSVDRSLIPAGTTSGAITVTTPAGSQAIPVSLVGISAAASSVSPSSLSLSYVSEGVSPASVLVVTTVPGGTFSATIGAPWLVVAGNSRVSPTTTQLALFTSPASLAPGTYSTTVLLTFSNSDVVPVPVTLTVSPGALSVSPSSLTFDQITSPTQNLILTASFGQPFNVTTSTSWLTVTPATGTTTGTITPISVTVNPSGLSPASYQGTITVAVGGQTQIVPVTLTVPPPVSVSPANLVFTYTPGGSAPISQTLTLSTASPTTFTTTSTVPWFAVGPTSGSIGPSSPALISVGVQNPASLSPGTYTGIITVVTPLGIATVPVSLTVAAPTPSATITPSSLSFTHQLGTAPPPPQLLTISSAAPGTFQVTTSATWLKTATSSASVPGVIPVTVDPQGLPAGPYAAVLSILSGGTFRTIPVVLNVTPSTVLRTSPTAVTFYYQPGGTIPSTQSQSVSLTSTGESLVVSTSNAGANWLQATATQAPGVVNITASAAGLPPGTYTTNVTISGPGPAAVQLPVTLIVSTAPILDVTPRTLQLTRSVPRQVLRVTSSLSPAPTIFATPGNDWLSVSPTTQQAPPATFTITADTANSPSGTRYGAIVIDNPNPLSVFGNTPLIIPVEFINSACASLIGPPDAPAPAAGTVGSIAVTATCPWSATSNASWITLLSGASGTGAGTVTFRVAPNTGPARSGTITIDQSTFTITQAPPTATPVGLSFVSMLSCRVADTRLAFGPLGGPRLSANTTRSFPIPSACGIRPDAAAYSLNVTVVPAGVLSYLTLWPTGQPQPFVSTLNSFDGRSKANAAIVPAGTNGAVSVFATDPTEVVLDINGYFVPSDAGGSSFYPLPPCRLLDTRLSSGPLLSDIPRSFPAAGNCGIPATLQAYSLNVTVVPASSLGSLSLWTESRPLVSTLTAPTGAITANAAFVQNGNGSVITVEASNGTTDLVLDTNGYFGPPSATGLSFYPIVPCRISDTRLASAPLGGPILAANQSRTIPIQQSACGIPATARAYSLNATVVPSGPLSYLTLWPSGSAQPLVSTLNSFDASTVSNAAIVPAGANGSINAFVTGPTHLILDINGYFQ